MPHVPSGLPPCTAAVAVDAQPSRAVGELVRYLVDVDGLSLGSVDFRIVRRGTFAGAAATEYRSLFRLDGLVASLVAVEGRAAALVTDAATGGSRAMNRYRLTDLTISEDLEVAHDGRTLRAERHRGDEAPTTQTRRFAAPVHDFVAAYYVLRALPPGIRGCTLIYGHGRTFTIWLEPQGREEVKTPVGLRQADHLAIRYASERGRAILLGDVWLGADATRLPYRAELRGPHHLVARVHLFEAGSS